MYEKIVIVTRKTRLQGLIERFNTKEQAKFYIEHAGGEFSDYVSEDEAYQTSTVVLERSLRHDIKLQFIDREFLSTFLFSKKDIVVALGQDGLVANAAKYVGEQPLVGVNPDAKRFDGILVGHSPGNAYKAVKQILNGKAHIRKVTLAQVALNDGQQLLAFNDFFVGIHNHTSARYRIEYRGLSELQSSSGLLVSTGAGSTGWLSSMYNMAFGIASFSGGVKGNAIQMPWEDPRLVFIVREPFVSKHSSASIVAGIVNPGQQLVIESRMPSEGVIFSDGIQADFLEFNSGAIAYINTAEQKAHIVAPSD